MKKCKRLLAFFLCIATLNSICGCSVIDEQWEVAEKYRLENMTKEEKEASEAKEATTTETLPPQNVLADFMDYESNTLGGRIAVPNGYKRINDITDKTSKKKNSKSKASSEQTTEAVNSGDSYTLGGAVTESDNALGEAVSGDASVAATDNSLGGVVSGDASGEAATTTESTTEESTTEERKNSEDNKYTIEQFMRTLPVKREHSRVVLYTGEEKEKQDSYAAILNLGLDNRNLQQRASSIMRLYAEYYWTNKDFSNMEYKLGNGFILPYKKWSEGYRVDAVGADNSWYTYCDADDSYDTLQSYLEYYFSYSGMATLMATSHQKPIESLSVGDFFIGEKEYCAMVVDMAENENGERCFLLASGGSPGQEIEVLKNPAHEDPWYYVSELGDTFATPEFELKADFCYHLTTTDNPAVSGDASGNAASGEGVNKN